MSEPRTGTVYGGRRPTPQHRPDWVLLGAAGFLVLAVVVGGLFALQGMFGGSGPSTAGRGGTGGSAGTTAADAPAPSPTDAPPTDASPTSTPAQGQVPAAATQLRAAHSQLCLQTNDGNGGNGVQARCDGNPTQLWTPQPVPNTRDTYKFVNAKDNRCLDVNGASRDNGAVVLQWDCHAGANQQWKLVPNGGDAVLFVSVNSGKCISVVDNSDHPNANLVQWDCNGSSNQRWQFPQG